MKNIVNYSANFPISVDKNVSPWHSFLGRATNLGIFSFDARERGFMVEWERLPLSVGEFVGFSIGLHTHRLYTYIYMFSSHFYNTYSHKYNITVFFRRMKYGVVFGGSVAPFILLRHSKLFYSTNYHIKYYIILYKLSRQIG